PWREWTAASWRRSARIRARLFLNRHFPGASKMPSLDRLHKPVLVLNASYEPINICAARRALVLVLKGVASAEELSSSHVHSSRHTIRVPSVIRLLEYRRIPHQTRALSRKNILMRDRYTCQYCHRTLPSSELTL